MSWKALADDVPLDHEALQPPQQPMGAGDEAPSDQSADFAPLPDNVPLDQEREPPPIVGHVHTGSAEKPEPKSEEVNPTYTEAGFDGQIHPDRVYHTGLTDADKKEYASFFSDPKHPPTAAKLQMWYHEKTGALLGNAPQIVDIFKKSGKFSTAEKISIPKPKTSASDAYFDHTANAVAADYGPEAAAALATLGIGGDGPNVWNSDQSMGDMWANNADALRTRLDAESEDHPLPSMAGEVSGIAAATPLAGAAGDAVGLAKLGEAYGETNRALIQGATEGGAYGSGAAGPGHRGEGFGLGVATVPAVGFVAKAPVLAYTAGKSVLQGSPGLARRIIAKAIKEDANTPESVGADISAAHANDVPMALADTGENTRGLLAAASRTSGMARTVARDALDERQAGLADRVTKTIERDLGPVANPHKIADDLMTQARTEAAPLYEKAYARPEAQAFGDRIVSLLKRPSMKQAIGKAYRIAQEEGRDPETLGFSKFKPSDSSILDASGKPMQVDEIRLTKVPSWQTLDYIKRGMDDVIEGYRDSVTGKLRLDTEGRAINNTQRSFLSAFDAANPDYAAARAAYAGPVKGISAMNTGRKFLNMTADDIEARMRDMSPFEKQMAALGTRRAMAELVASKGDTADVVHALVGTGKKRAMIARLFGDRKQFQRFVDTLGQEREGFRTFKQARLGSSTAANQMDDAALQTATLAVDMATTGLPIATSIRHALKFGFGKLGEKAKQQIAALLSDTNPASIRELAAELRAEAEKRGLNRRRINTGTQAVGKGVVVLQQAH